MSLRSIVAIASLALAGLAARQDPPSAGAGADRGHRLFDVHCARCHGIGGGGGEGPPLQRPVLPRAPDDATLIEVIQNGIPRTAMVGSFALSDSEASLVAQYVRSLGRSGPASATGQPARGRAIYQAQGCEACHILAGSGRGIGPELTSIGALRGVAHLRESMLAATAVVADEYRVLQLRTRSGDSIRGVRVSEDDFALVVRDANAALHSFRVADLESRRRQMGDSLMPSYRDRLTDAEVEDLVAFLAAQRGGR